MAEDYNVPLDEDNYILLVSQSGYWSICAVADPTCYEDIRRADSRWLHLVFDGNGWVAVFCDTLGVFDWAGEGRISVRDYEWRIAELTQRGRESFKQVTAQYPMLGRFNSEDVIYKRTEVARLREECLRVLRLKPSPAAVDSLNILVKACEEAMELDYGLFFAGP